MAKCAISEKSLPVFEYLKAHDGEELTASDIAIGMGMCDADDKDAVTAATKSVNAVITSGIIGTGANKETKGYAKRVEATITLEDGTIKPIKLVELTDKGRAYDHEASVKADIEAAMSK